MILFDPNEKFKSFSYGLQRQNISLIDGFKAKIESKRISWHSMYIGEKERNSKFSSNFWMVT